MGCRRVFLCYRRTDSPESVARIYDLLTSRLGRDNVFRDLDCIPLGADFRRVVDSQLQRCDAFLAMIGPGWLSAVESGGNRRLDDPEDHVRLEIESALRREIPVVPVLVSHAEMPKVATLPESLRGLAFRNGLPVRPDPDFHRDMDVLVSRLGLTDVTTESESTTEDPQPVRTIVASLSGYRLLRTLRHEAEFLVEDHDGQRVEVVRGAEKGDHAYPLQLRRANLARRVQHSNVLAVYEAIESDPLLIVRQHGVGDSLSRFIDDSGGPRQPAEVADLFSKLALGLHAAHAQGLVHGSMTPAEILVDDQTGELRLRLPGDGGWFGQCTPSYVAPEQFSGAHSEADGRVDIWSFGVILYETLAGCRPFTGRTTMDLAIAMSSAPPPPIRQYAPDVPESLERLCLRCLAKRPDERYASIADVAAGLAGAADDESRSFLRRVWPFAGRKSKPR